MKEPVDVFMRNNQEKKRALQAYGKLNRSIEQKLLEYERVKSLCEKVTTTITGMPKGGGVSHEDMLLRLSELSKRIDEEVDAYVDKRGEIEAAINTVMDPVLQNVLRYRYINCMTFEQIAVKMSYSYMHICRLHGAALEAVRL